MKNLKPNKAVATRYGVTTRTIDRWNNNDKLGFPKPIVINGRNITAKTNWTNSTTDAPDAPSASRRPRDQ
jgi:hypothetical protein